MKHKEALLIIACLLIVGFMFLSVMDYCIEHYPVFSLFCAAFLFMAVVLVRAAYKKSNKLTKN